MAAQLRELRSRIKATKSISKITKAMELIATSRISKARARVDGVPALRATRSPRCSPRWPAPRPTSTHPLLVERANPKRAACSSSPATRAQCGGYNANVLRAAEELQSLLREQGKDAGALRDRRKGVSYYRFRDREVDGRAGPGFSEQARATTTRRRPASRWSSRSSPAPTTTMTSRAPTASSASTSCTSCTRSSARCCRSGRSPSASRRSRSSTPRRPRRTQPPKAT